jgi:hypothetical protein
VTPHRQRILAGGPVPGDCLRACVASLLDLPYDTVPHFGLYVSWWDTLRRWVREHHDTDFAPLEPVGGSVRPFLRDPDRTPLIATGPSPRSERRHAVLVDADLHLVHDPHPSGAGLPAVDEVYVPILPYWPGPAAPAALVSSDPARKVPA